MYSLPMTPEQAVDRWPYAPGESPYHIKGVAYSYQLSLVDSLTPGGIEGLLHSLHNDRLDVFLRQRFLASGFYDLMPMIALGNANARLLKMHSSDYHRNYASKQAEGDLNGIYRVIIKVVSGARAGAAMAMVATRYLDFAPLSFERVTDKMGKLTCKRYPLPLATWYFPVLEGYYSVILRHAGGTNVQLNFSYSKSDTDERNVDLIDFSADVHWT